MSEIPSSEHKYQIWQHVPEGHLDVIDPYLAPWGIDFRTDLESSLYRVQTDNLGVPITELYYASYDPATGQHSMPVVESVYTYEIEPLTGFPIFSQETINFFLEDGQRGPHPKVLNPFYYQTLDDKIKFIEKKRRRQTSNAAEVAIGALMQVIGMDQVSALQAGQGYWGTLTEKITLFHNGRCDDLRQQIAQDSAASTPAWLPQIEPLIQAQLA